MVVPSDLSAEDMAALVLWASTGVWRSITPGGVLEAAVNNPDRHVLIQLAGDLGIFPDSNVRAAWVGVPGYTIPGPSPPIAGAPPEGDPPFDDFPPFASPPMDTPVLGAMGSLSLAGMAAMGIGRPIIGTLLVWARSVGARGAVQWNRLPRWIQIVLGAVGVDVGTTILFDEDDLPRDIINLLPGVGGGAPETIQVRNRTWSLLPGWTANGVRFYRTQDKGWFAVQNKHGQWNVFRQRKMVVLPTTGAPDLRTLLKADKIIQKQAGQVAKMLRNRGYSVHRKHAKGSKALPEGKAARITEITNVD